MPLKAVLSSADELTDELKPFYVEKDGKFILDVAPVGGMELSDVSGLKTALGKERETARLAKEKLERFGDLDVAKATEAMNKVAEMSNWTPEEKVKEKIEAQISQVVERSKAEKDAVTKRAEAYAAQLKQIMVTKAAFEALAENGAIEPNVLIPHIERFVRMREENGQMITEVIDEHGNPRVADSSASPMNVAQLVAEFKTKPGFDILFKGTEQKGSGAPAGGKGGAKLGSKTITTAQLHAGGVDLEAIASGEVQVVD